MIVGVNHLGTPSSVPVYHASGEQVFLSVDLILLQELLLQAEGIEAFLQVPFSAKGISVGAGETRCFHVRIGVKRQFFEWIIQKIPSLSFESII